MSNKIFILITIFSLSCFASNKQIQRIYYQNYSFEEYFGEYVEVEDYSFITDYSIDNLEIKETSLNPQSNYSTVNDYKYDDSQNLLEDAYYVDEELREKTIYKYNYLITRHSLFSINISEYLT